MELMSGKELAGIIYENLETEVKSLSKKLTLAVILIGNNLASEKYVGKKKEACEKIGVNFKLIRFPEEVKQTEVQAKIDELNGDDSITGMIVQLPISKHLDVDTLLESIDPKKDVDGLNTCNLGNLVKGLDGLFPATPEGVINLLRYYQIPLAGKKVVVIGQSNLVGKPLILMLFREKATVLCANSRTVDLKELTHNADVVISATGVPKILKADMIKKGAVVVDVGTAAVDGKIVGDVDFEEVSKKASFITPNPGGVGPMTVAMLLSNIVKAGKFE